LEPAKQYHVQKINQLEKKVFDFETDTKHCNGKMKTAFYHACKLLVKLVFGCIALIRVIGRENPNRSSGFLLASNHISHFDPFLIGLAVRRKIDWMTMSEFFRAPALGFLLRSIDAFPAERDHADLKTIRTAIERLKHGRVVGIFPEGGIRDGARSLLQGAPLRPGAATLAQVAGVPSEVEGARCKTLNSRRGIPRLRFASLGMTCCGGRAQERSMRSSADRSISYTGGTG